MEFNDISDITGITEGFSQSEDQDLSIEVGKEKTESLKKSISEINDLVVSREKLSKETFDEAEKIKTEINNFLLENEASKIADSDLRDNTKEKNDLRSKKIGISELQLNEKIGCWKDIALLKKEKRVYEQELNEKEARLLMLNKLMGDK